jgi:hypothetical protein
MVAPQMPPAQVAANIVSRLASLRNALQEVQNLYAWSSGTTAADFETYSGYSTEDGPSVQAAIADANALAEIYLTGLPPSTYPQPASAYVYETTQAAVIGPT